MRFSWMSGDTAHEVADVAADDVSNAAVKRAANASSASMVAGSDVAHESVQNED
jgi:hypothetical protein